MSKTDGIARRSASYPAAELVVANGVKTSFASSASQVVLGAADYNGAQVANSGANWKRGLPRQVSISRSNSPGSYTTDPIVLEGTVAGEKVTEPLTPANANGNDTLYSNQLWDNPPAITLPAQVNTSGAFTIGVQDIGAPGGEYFTGAKLHATGYLNVDYGDSQTDEVPCASQMREWLAFLRLLTNAALTNPTTVGVTVYCE